MRRPDWPVRLDAVLAVWRTQPFAWGRHDCAQFALAVLQAVSAQDWAQVHISSYNSARGAARMLKRLGVRSMPELATLLLGAGRPPAYAAAGDLVSEGRALGVCVGARLAHPGPQGLVLLPRSAAVICWKI